MHKTLIAATLALLASLPAHAQERTPSGAASVKNDVSKQAEQIFRSSFRGDNPKYWMGRLEQDDAMRVCSQYRDNPPAKQRQKIELAQKATIRYPVDGKLIGDWKEGEKLASSGRGGHIGFIQPDAPMTPRGGNCYACHQLDKKEVSYGTLGPSLAEYGKIRKFSPEENKQAYAKIFNSHSVMPCSNMPRFGANKFLTIEQIKDVTAYLMSPDSPVNK